MKRLTIKTPKGAALDMDNTYPDETTARADLMKRYRIAVDRLAAYEDSGLMPEQIKALVEGESIRRGVWEGEGDGYADGAIVYDVWRCSECDYTIDDGTDNPEMLPNYCPECGAEMRTNNLSKQKPNTPLTLKELQEMDGEPVYITRINDSHIESGWALVHREWCGCKTASGCVAFFERYVESWLAYRRKPEEGSHGPSDPAVPNWAEHLQSRFLRTE